MSIPLKKLNVQGKVRLDGKLLPVRFFFFFRDRSSACDSLIAVLLGSNIYRGYAAQRSSSCFASSCPLGYSLATHRIKKRREEKKEKRKQNHELLEEEKKKKKAETRVAHRTAERIRGEFFRRFPSCAVDTVTDGPAVFLLRFFPPDWHSCT